MSGIIISFGILVAIFQIRLLKKDIRIRNERASKERSIEAASRYLSDYVNFDGVFFNEVQEKKLNKRFEGPYSEFKRGKIHASGDFIKRLSCDSILPALNELEAISAYFVTGVGDEETGFSIIGKTFCHTVESKYDIISFLHDSGGGQPYYSNIVILYGIWRPRLTKEQLEIEKKILDGKISSVAGDRKISPIGL